ncbi:hypothetical protein B1M_18947, partial [Burkholderia sp. TJI49]
MSGTRAGERRPASTDPHDPPGCAARDRTPKPRGDTH